MKSAYVLEIRDRSAKKVLPAHSSSAYQSSVGYLRVFHRFFYTTTHLYTQQDRQSVRVIIESVMCYRTSNGITVY